MAVTAFASRYNEMALIDGLRQRYDAFSAHLQGVEDLNRRFQPNFKAIHLRCCQEDAGFNRLAEREGDALPGWSRNACHWKERRKGRNQR